MSTRFPKTLDSGRFRLALLIVAVVMLGSFGLGVRARLKSSLAREAAATVKNSAATLTQDPAAASQSKPPGTRLPSHLLTLQPSGFEPKEAVWPSGAFFVSVNNRSSVNDITLRMDRQGGERLREVSLKMRKQRSAGVFDLPPGQYVLSEANHPEWTCQITITAK